MMSSDNNIIPQVGRADCSQSHPVSTGSSTDSGKSNQPTSMPNMETNTQDEEMTNPFQRRESVARSPPMLRHAIEANKLDSTEADECFENLGNAGTSTDITDGNDGARREPKRKREDTPVKMKTNETNYLHRMEKEHDMLKELMRRTTNEIKTLRKLIKKIPNTKKQIRTAINKLDEFSKRMPNATKYIEELMEELRTTGYKNETAAVRNTTEMGTQTISKQHAEKLKVMARIEDALDKELSDNELKEIIDLKWPEEIYKKMPIRRSRRMHKGR
ncbi:unnamed protein product [Phaedon cochleariae]|uniref:Uncharacterized protein n=1 Tax=Phaedon cochleariae TaxID=80249 RepID=A0A9P0DJS3_PHACE|nr:unnamed protein product [Phaedon cochleariae]